MSRVFSAMTGSVVPRSPAAPVAPQAPSADPLDDHFVETDDAPFVEIGGPAGPVFSAAARPAPKALPEVPPARPFPRIVADAPPATPFLSVRFHDTAPPGAERAAGGPDAGLVALHHPDHPISGEYRTLRDEIARQLPDATSRAVTFTAAGPEAGTTTVLANLAVTLALGGQRVLVVDANVTRPGVAQKFALRPAPGLAEVLGGSIPLTWALQPTPVPSLQALAAGTPTDSVGEAVGRDLPKLLGQLRQWFDWVLVDAGVWGVIPERDSTCAAADAVYLVTREADADRPEFTGLRTWVKQLGGALRGYVSTRV